nr:MAG TPA: Calcineurin-like phosphoesterase [Caudoviricetes sp.]
MVMCGKKQKSCSDVRTVKNAEKHCNNLVLGNHDFVRTFCETHKTYINVYM